MKSTRWVHLCLLCVITLLLMPLQGTWAQAGSTPAPQQAADSDFEQPDVDKPVTSEEWFANRPVEVQSTLSSGGPDDFGYTWDDTVPLNWMDLSGGTDAGITNEVEGTGPVDLGFSFKYYENVYSQIYISRNGFLAFNDDRLTNDQSHIPSTESPDDVIAPHWVPTDRINGYVKYARGGTSPNRWFAVEWNQAISDCCGDGAEEYTFEAILYESGDIVFQYGTMIQDGGFWCQASGIEDSYGLDGLSITGFCNQVPGNHAVRIYRPPASARVRLWPPAQGEFVEPLEVVTFRQSVRNTGEFGTDTYDLFTASNWPVSLYAGNGLTPLTDTDGDGTVDTGAIPQGGEVEIVIQMKVPVSVSSGDANTAAVTVRSSVDDSKYRIARFQGGVPVPFAQVLTDRANGEMAMDLVRPTGDTLVTVTDDYRYGYDPAVAEMPSGAFVYVWNDYHNYTTATEPMSRYGVDSATYGYEIEYALVSPYGEVIRAPSRLADHSGAVHTTYDYDAAVAVAPDGRVGIAWYRYIRDSVNGVYNYNIYFAILDRSGNLIHGPENVTLNGSWGAWSDYGVPRFYSPHIAATDDNRFVLLWQRQDYESAGWTYNHYYSVRNTSGGTVKGITQFTTDAAGNGDGYTYEPNIATLSGGRVLLLGRHYLNGESDIFYGVIDSNGNVVRGQTPLSGIGYDWSPDAVQLTDGRIVVAWTGGYYPDYQIVFSVLDGNYNVIAGPTPLNNPASLAGDGYVSVARAGTQAVLTWMDYSSDFRPNLYYALVDGTGAVVTEPMIFYSSWASDPSVYTSYYGYGNAPLSFETAPPTVSDLDYPAVWSPGRPVTVTWQAGGAWLQDVELAWDVVSHAGDNEYSSTTPGEVLGGGRYRAVVTMPASGNLYFKARAANWGGDAWSSEGRIEGQWLRPEVTSHVSGLTNEAAPQLKGKAPAGTTVTIYDGTTPIATTPATSSGNFEVTLPGLGAGQHVLTLKASQGGNESPLSTPMTLTVQPDLKVDPVGVEVSTPNLTQRLRDEQGYATIGLESRIWVREGEEITLRLPVSGTQVISAAVRIEGPGLGEVEVPLTKDQVDPEIWSGETSLPATGYYSTTAIINDQQDLSEVPMARLISDEKGVIRDGKTGDPLSDAQVTASYYNQQTKQWEAWNGKAWEQTNPQTTAGSGLYQFMPYPAGLYRIKVERPGYWAYESDPLEVTAEPLRMDVVLQPRYDVYLPAMMHSRW